MANINWPWAIILCRFNDVPTVPQARDYYEDLFTRNGTGGLCDYWRAVSCNALDLTGSRVFGWFTMNHSSPEVHQLHFPGDRSTLVQWGLDAAAANGVNIATFRSVLIVHNFGVDHGAAGNGILIVHQNDTLCEYGFIAHEMGHGFGLPHSFAANPDMEYWDGWDLMSFATTTFQFPIEFKGTRGDATVGINARNLEALGAVPPGRTWVPSRADFSAHVTLDALNQPPIGNHGALIAKIRADATLPIRQNGSSYTVEFRRKAGWDRGIPEDAVLIHEVRSNSLSYLQPTVWGQFKSGEEFVTPDPKVFVRVANIDSARQTAALRIWDLPEGSLRKEDSKPKVFLIENGKKRWVVSPQVLFALGKNWNDVRVVPDGGLRSVPDGPDRQLPYRAFRLQTATALHPTDDTFEFGIAANADVIAIKKSGTASNTTEIHVLSAASGYQQFSLQTATALHPTDRTFEFGIGPNNDVFAIKKSGTGSGMTEIHVLSAASGYQQFSLQTKTALHPTDDTFEFGIAPNGDVFAIKKSGTASGTTEIHVLSAASGYQQFSLQTRTTLHPTDPTFEFGIATNRDVFAIKKSSTGPGMTEIHVLSAASGYQQFSLQTQTALHPTDRTFEFGVAANRDAVAIKKAGTASGTTEVHVLEQ